MDIQPTDLSVDRTAISVVSLDAADDELLQWLACSPTERIHHMQRLRILNYGHRASERLQRALEVAELTSS